jgi:hypothetical protein
MYDSMHDNSYDVKGGLMNLDYLLLADKAEAVNGKLYAIGAGVHGIGMAQIPGKAAVDIAVGLLVDYAGTGDTHQLSLSMETADNQTVLGPISVPFATGTPPGLPAGDELPFTLVVQGPFPIPSEGAYQWVAEVDGERFAPRHFRVTRVTPLVPRPET